MSREIPGSTARRIKLGLLFLGRKRPGFDPDWGARMERQVREAVAKTEFEIVEPPEKVVDDASLRTALAGFEQSRVETVVALQTTMADARMAPTLAQLWSEPILLWATPENPQGDRVSSCSLVGLHAWASVFRQMDHLFEIIYIQHQIALANQIRRKYKRNIFGQLFSHTQTIVSQRIDRNHDIGMNRYIDSKCASGCAAVVCHSEGEIIQSA